PALRLLHREDRLRLNLRHGGLAVLLEPFRRALEGLTLERFSLRLALEWLALEWLAFGRLHLDEIWADLDGADLFLLLGGELQLAGHFRIAKRRSALRLQGNLLEP